MQTLTSSPQLGSMRGSCAPPSGASPSTGSLPSPSSASTRPSSRPAGGARPCRPYSHPAVLAAWVGGEASLPGPRRVLPASWLLPRQPCCARSASLSQKRWTQGQRQHCQQRCACLHACPLPAPVFGVPLPESDHRGGQGVCRGRLLRRRSGGPGQPGLCIAGTVPSSACPTRVCDTSWETCGVGCRVQCSQLHAPPGVVLLGDAAHAVRTPISHLPPAHAAGLPSAKDPAQPAVAGVRLGEAATLARTPCTALTHSRAARLPACCLPPWLARPACCLPLLRARSRVWLVTGATPALPAPLAPAAPAQPLRPFNRRARQLPQQFP